MTLTKVVGTIPRGNSKLGELIHSWSIPAGKEFTCVGASALCERVCYAKRGHYRWGTTSAAHRRNLQASRQADFVAWAVDTLRSKYTRVLRIHAAGDFYDHEYTRKWIAITQACPNVLFYAYTRSWSDDTILPELQRLSRGKNVRLWWSIDRQTGPAPLTAGVRRAYMAIDDADARTAPADADLVFRDDPRTVMKSTNGVRVCPVENGVSTKIPITCSSCGICWKQQDTVWEKLMHSLLTETMEINY